MTRIVIFANGTLNKPQVLRTQLRPDDHIFCADGGALHALAMELTPEAVIGDLDSIPPDLVKRLEARDVAIHRYPPAKDQTDLELALRHAMEMQPDEILLVTALGGRLDQMLANILLLTHPDYAAVRMTLADGGQWAVLVRSHQQVTVRGQPGDTVSLVPLTPAVTGVSFKGVAWPLEEATLTLGSSWSISNRLTGKQASVQIEEGMLLLVHFKQSDEEDL